MSQPDLFQPAAKPRRRIDFVLPRSAKEATCSSCGAAIAWIETSSGRRMPLDLSTVHHTPESADRAESHFAHCPAAKKHRQPR